MAYRYTPILRVLIALLALSALTTSAIAQEDWSSKVLKQKDVAQKERTVCVQGAKGVSAETLANLINKERHGPAVVSAIGQFLETANLDNSAPDLIRRAAKRPDINAQALAYAAVCPRAPDLIIGFSASDSENDQLIAAKLIAATAAMRRQQDMENQKPSAKAKGAPSTRLDVSYEVEINRLIETCKDDVALEYLLLAIGLDKVKVPADTLRKHVRNKDAGVAMAAQFALAALGEPIDEDAVLRAIQRRPKRGVGKPVLSYDPRQLPRTYAMMAAGQAKLASAKQPLMTLVKDRDLNTAVNAVRALGQMGGEGIAVQLLAAIEEKTPWPVSVAIYDAAGQNPDKAALPLLRERFEEEQGRFRQDALYAMLSIVAGKPKGMTREAFDEWWLANGEAFEVDVRATLAWRDETSVGQAEVTPIAGFYESAVISERPVFSVDASVSMRGAQIESLKQTLRDLVESFPERISFNIVDFGGHVRTLAPGGMIPARNRKRAMDQFIYEMELTGGTRAYDAIERGMNIPGMDTVHFLSDGAPYGSDLKSWRRIEYVTRLYCQTVPVAVHLIYFPEPGKGKNKKTLESTMKSYAEANAGRYHVIEVAAE